jgi:molecular chaperone GrpE (heat shock protein)
MWLEPNICRLQALTCERLAQRSTSPIVKDAYADLAKKWLKVADDLEAFINAREPERREHRIVSRVDLRITGRVVRRWVSGFQTWRSGRFI